MRIIHLCILVCSITFLTTCQNPSSMKQTAQHLHISLSADPSSLDPRRGGDSSKAIVEFMLFEGLTRFNEEGKIEPAGASDIAISPDRKTYTFTLKQNSWSDASIITAYDYEKTWKEILSPDFPSSFSHLLYCIKNARDAKQGAIDLDKVGIEAKDAQTLVVELEHPTPYFLELTAFYTFFPVKLDSTTQQFLYNGPFRLMKWIPNSEIYLEKNPDYWNASALKLDQITIHIIDNEITTLHMFEKEELDMAGMPLAPLPLQALPTLYKAGKLCTQPVAGSTLCVFNTQQSPFSNRNIRKAFALSIHKQQIVDFITQIGEEVATNIIPPALLQKTQPPLPDAYNVTQAQAYLAQGLGELEAPLPTLTYIYPPGELNKKIAEFLQHQWHDHLGIKVHIEQLEKKDLLARLDAKNYQMGQAAWLAFYNDPIDVLERFKYKENSKNYPGWENPRYRELLDSSCTEVESVRWQHLESAEQLLMEEVPLTVLYHWKYGFLKRANLKGILISPIGDIHFTHAYFE